MKKYATKGSHEGEQQQYTQYTFLLYSSRAHTFPDVYFYINNRCPSILQWPILEYWTLVADFRFWTLVADFGFWPLMADFEDWTLMAYFKDWTLVADFKDWTLVADFGFWIPVANFGILDPRGRF